jgi:betaine-aldehyde dehydrogenase
VFKDSDLESAAKGAASAIFFNHGQCCCAGSRLYVERKAYPEVIERVADLAKKIKLGPGMASDTQMGPLVSKEQQDRVSGFVKAGEKAGAKPHFGGDAPGGEYANGYYVRPTLFENTKPDMSIVREEIFGPVMSVLEFDDEQEVVARANATEFGLAAGVFTNDLTRAHRVIAGLQAGTCWINHYNVTPIELPFGGVKMSGLGRENGRAAMEHYTQLKSVYVAKGDVDAPY